MNEFSGEAALSDASVSPEGGLSRPGARALLAALLALVPIVVLCLAHAPVYATPPDDAVQELFARGQFQASASSLMPYTLVLVSAPLSALYQLASGVPWYALTLLALIFVSFAVTWAQALSLGLKRAQLVCVGAAIVASEALCVLYFTFTIVAFIAFAAGLVLIMPRAVFGDAGRPGARDVFGLLLVAVGFSLRPESGEAALLLFAPFFFYALVRSRRAGTMLRALAVIAVIAACYVGGQTAYRLTPGWEDFPSYLDAGRKVLDTQAMSTEEVQAAAPELSDNDVTMLYAWDFVDHDVFGTETLERIGANTSSYGLSHLVASLKAKITYLLIALAAALAVVALALARMRRLEPAARNLSLGVVGMTLVSYLLIVMRGRPRLHIVIPIAVVTLMALLVCCAGPCEAGCGRHSKRDAVPVRPVRPVRSRLLAGAVCAICVLGVAGFWYTSVRPLWNRLSLPFSSAVQEYVEENPDELVVFAHTQSAWLSGTDAFASASWQCPGNVLFVGGWESETAPWDETLERWGLTDGDALQQLASRDDMVLVATESTAEAYETYLSEHTGASVKKQKVEDLGSGAITSSVISVWSFDAE